MNYLIILIVLTCFIVLYFLIREKIVVTEQVFYRQFSPDSVSKIGIRKKLIKNYLKKSSKITANIYQSLTGVSLTEASQDLEKFVSEGFLRKFAEGGEIAFYDLESPYNRQYIYEQVNRQK